jgi:hypothetical protein
MARLVWTLCQDVYIITDRIHYFYSDSTQIRSCRLSQLFDVAEEFFEPEFTGKLNAAPSRFTIWRLRPDRTCRLSGPNKRNRSKTYFLRYGGYPCCYTHDIAIPSLYYLIYKDKFYFVKQIAMLPPILSYYQKSQKNSAVNICIVVESSFQASSGRPALRQVLIRNVSLFQLFSIATCGRSNP